MRIVLLPAFDGTGKLFKELQIRLGNHILTQAIAYPETGPQNYEALTEYVLRQIPAHESYVILGESFAGPLAYQIATSDPDRCVGAIFVATYLENPSPTMLKVIKHIPAKIVSWFVSNAWVVKTKTLGKQASPALAKKIAANYGSVAAVAIKDRLMVINALQTPPKQPLDLPCFYIQADQDKLVKPKELNHYQALCPQLEVASANGGHFVIQENPNQCAYYILSHIEKCRPQTPSHPRRSRQQRFSESRSISLN